MPIEVIKQIIRYRQIKAWYETYERVLIPGTLVFGVIVDSVTFASIETRSAFLLLGAYAGIAGGVILFVHAYDARTHWQMRRTRAYVRLCAPLLLQFAFGALLSASFIFYLFSGSLFVSWPFLAILVILMVSNDVFRRYYGHPVVQVGVYFFILFSLLSIMLPFAVNAVGTWVFAISGVFAVALIAAYCALLMRMAPQLSRHVRRFAWTVGTITACVGILYVTNVIPPIPLSVRQATLAHDVMRTQGEYALTVEQESWWQKLLPGRVFHKQESGRVFVYTAIFAPQDVHTDIVHHWQYYDEAREEWVSRDRLAFQVSGGRQAGFRGYSVKTQVQPGKWRVDVETERGQVVGRVRFTVKAATELPQLKTVRL